MQRGRDDNTAAPCMRNNRNIARHSIRGDFFRLTQPAASGDIRLDNIQVTIFNQLFEAVASCFILSSGNAGIDTFGEQFVTLIVIGIDCFFDPLRIELAQLFGKQQPGGGIDRAIRRRNKADIQH